MPANLPPKKPVQFEPAGDHWLALARELADNPDSPASLKIMSAVSQAIAPRQRANDQVIEALEAQIQDGGEQEDVAVAAAVQYWEREFKEAMPLATRADLTGEAVRRIERRRRQPPAIETILGRRPDGTDTGYTLGVHLLGLDGTWHRLWGIIAMAHSFGNDVAHDGGVATVRGQFQELLGRALSATEWDALVAHAVHHAETIMMPSLRLGDDPARN